MTHLLLPILPFFSMQNSPSTDQNRPPVSSESKVRAPKFGLDYTARYFTNSRTKSVFGKGFFMLQPGFRPILVKPGVEISPDIDFLMSGRSSSTNKAFLLSAGVSARFSSGSIESTGEGEERIKQFAPYYGFALNAVYADVSSQTLNTYVKKGGAAIGVFAGATLSKNAFVEIGYKQYTKISSIDFSSSYITVGVRF